jgi:hypothetical protein
VRIFEAAVKCAIIIVLQQYDWGYQYTNICGTIVPTKKGSYAVRSYGLNRKFWYDRTRGLNYSRIYCFAMKYDIMLDRYAPVPFIQIKRYDRTNKKGVICGTIVRPNRKFWYDRTRGLNYSRIYCFAMRYDTLMYRYGRVPSKGVICGTVPSLYWYEPYPFVIDISYHIGTLSCWYALFVRDPFCGTIVPEFFY